MLTAAAVSGAELLFEPEPHIYRTPSGLVVPSVTQILKETGVATDFDEIAARGQRIADAIDYKRALGTAAHADCHAYDDNDIDWTAVHPDVEPYVRAWATFRQNTGLQPLARERKVFHAAEWFCGTLDGLFEAKVSKRIILIDIKIGDPHHAAAHLQTAAYQLAYLAEHPSARIDERWAVRLIPGRHVPYDVTPYTDWRDTNKFRAVLTTYAEQPARRRRA